MASALTSLPLLLLVLMLIASGQVDAIRKRGKKHRVCNNPKPVCKSDRFDVVFSHYDDYKCKVHKCQCRIPDTIDCPQGRSQIKTDTYGCQYYECVTCPAAQPACQGTQVSRYTGDDENGCPQYVCECPPNPTRPQCNSNEQIQSGTDNSGCPYYYCQQVRTNCPERPQCSDRQELVSAGVVGDCEIFRCECITPQEPSCPHGSQPRLQDDGLGCQEYRCVENRSPCPVEPTCPSTHQVVAQDGVDGNNCVKYVCKCIPLATITCPSGYRMELDTDEECGCQFYRCEPNCEPKPTCSSAFEHPVVMATRSNGCPSYSCECKQPEVISCAASDAILRLTRATDGSNCEVYVCQSADDNNNRNGNCPQANCANPISTGSLDSNGCPIFTCHGCSTPFCTDGSPPTITGNNGGCPSFVCQGSRACGIAPQCSGGQSTHQVGYINPTCPFYICQPNFCPTPNSCGTSQRPFVTTDNQGCAVVTCRTNNGGMCNSVPPVCQNNERLTFIGEDEVGCDEYICHRAGCPQPPTCTIGERLVRSGSAGACTTYTCQTTTRSCGARPNCGIGQQAQFVNYDGNGCAIYRCNGNRNGNRNGNGNSICPQPNCPMQQTAVPAGTDAFGCTQYMCMANGGNGGNRGGMVTGNCPNPQMCANGMQPPIISSDAFGCPVYGSCMNNGNRGGVIGGGFNNGGYNRASGTCPPQPDCQYHQFRVRSQQQLGNQVCTVYTCVNLGQYSGNPSKCLDNPTYCDDSQTIETYIERDGYKGRKKCQRVECKGSTNSMMY